MHRSPRRAVAALALTLLLGACGSDLPRDAVATVDGESIAAAELRDWVRDATTSNPRLVPADVQLDLLSRAIQNRIVMGVLAQRGLEVRPEDLAAVDADIIDQVGGPDGLVVTLIEVGFPPDFYQRIFLQTEAAIDLLVTDLVGDRALETRTVRHILVGTAEEAEEIVALLAEGADFATLATERSTDPGTAVQGGLLGARERGVYVEEFDDAVWAARIGRVLDPVATQFGFHVIEVLDASRTPAAELTSQDRRRLVGAELDVLLGAAVSAASVSIAPRIGVWDGSLGFVAPPGGNGAGGR